jgi:hypothetical protein
VFVPLVLDSHYRSLAVKQGGQSATVNVTFSAPGRPVVHGLIGVTFVDPQPARAAHGAKRKHKAPGGRQK